MKSRFYLLCFATLLAAALAYLASCKESKESKASPDAVDVTTMTGVATVQSVDPAKRVVALKFSDGSLHTYKCGPDVENFDQIKVGDHVKATVVDEVAVFVRKSDVPPSAATGSMVALSPRGAKPGVVITDATQVTAKVLSVDPKTNRVTLEGVLGNQHTFTVAKNVDLSGVKEGDNVVLRYTQALAIVVEKPGAK